MKTKITQQKSGAKGDEIIEQQFVRFTPAKTSPTIRESELFKLPENGDVSKILRLILEINPTRDQAEIINRACAKLSLINHPNRTMFRVCQVIPGEDRKHNKLEDVGKEVIISVENGELSEFGKKFLFKGHEE